LPGLREQKNGSLVWIKNRTRKMTEVLPEARKLLVEREADFHGHLPVSNFSIENVSPSFHDFEPAKFVDGFGSTLDCVLDSIFDRFGGTAHDFDFLVDVIGHIGLLKVGTSFRH
jgi:hypothetical protein